MKQPFYQVILCAILGIMMLIYGIYIIFDANKTEGNFENESYDPKLLDYIRGIGLVVASIVTLFILFFKNCKF